MTEPNPQLAQAKFNGLDLQMDFDRFAALEGLTGKKMPRLCTEFEMGLGLNDLVDWFRCFVVGEVPEAKIKSALRPGEKGMMADYDAANKVLGELMQAFFRPEEVTGAKPRPRKAA